MTNRQKEFKKGLIQTDGAKLSQNLSKALPKAVDNVKAFFAPQEPQKKPQKPQLVTERR